MNDVPHGMVEDLRRHQELCLRILALVERENRTLRGRGTLSGAEMIKDKNVLLLELESSLNLIRHHRAAWQRMERADQARMTEVPALLRQIQKLIMRVVMIDKENEQLLLRNGLVPSEHLPSANRQRPHYVADLYRRSGRA